MKIILLLSTILILSSCLSANDVTVERIEAHTKIKVEQEKTKQLELKLELEKEKNK